MQETMYCPICGIRAYAADWLEHANECDGLDHDECVCCGDRILNTSWGICRACWYSRCDAYPGSCDGRTHDYWGV